MLSQTSGIRQEPNIGNQVLSKQAFATTRFPLQWKPRFNESLQDEVFDITNDIPGPSFSKIYGREPRYNETSL